MNYIAHRHSAKSVYRFVPVIKQVLDSHRTRGTASVSFNPLELNLSVETGVARLRDAVFSLSSGLTEHGAIDASSLKEVWKLYRVTSDGVNVQVLPRTTEQDESVLIHTDSRDILATLQTNDLGFVEILNAFAVLLGKRLLQGQVAIHGDLSDNLKRQLECDNDVVITQVAPNQYQMI